ANRSCVPGEHFRGNGEPGPRGPTGETQVIEPREVVIVQTRGEDLRLPRRCRRLEALELRDQRSQRIRTFAPLRGNHMLPAAEKAHEVAARDRLDFLAQTLHRVAMNP